MRLPFAHYLGYRISTIKNDTALPFTALLYLHNKHGVQWNISRVSQKVASLTIFKQFENSSIFKTTPHFCRAHRP